MLRSVVFLLILMSGTAFAQRKKAPVFVVGRVISAEDSIRIKDYFYEALKEKNKQDITEASRYFKQILEIDPANDAALYELARLFHAQNQEKEAEIYARDAVTVNPSNKWYWLLLSSIYKKTRNLDELIPVFDELIKLEPSQSMYYYDKANALFILNKTDEAEQVYRLIENQFGSSENLINARQRVYQKQGNSSKAISDLEALIKKNPAEMRNYLNLSEIYLKEGDTDKTIEILKNARSLNSDEPYITLALADAYKTQGKNEAALKELKNAFSNPALSIDTKVHIILSFLPEFKNDQTRKETIDLASIITKVHPSDPKSFSVYGDVLYQDKQLANAKGAYKKALSLNPQVYQIWEQLLAIQISQRDFSGVITDGEEALSLFPNQAPLYFYTAIAYSQTQKHEKAISYFKNAASLETENNNFLSQVYSSLGDSYNSLKKYKESDEAYEKALALYPDNVYVLNNYAYYLSLRNENLGKAASMSKRSNELVPNNASFEDTYAWILFRQKNYKDARVWIEKAIKNNKDSAVQFEHFGDILYYLGENELALEQWKVAKAKGEKSETLEKKINEKRYIE